MSYRLFSVQAGKLLKKYSTLKRIILKSLILFYISNRYKMPYTLSFNSYYHYLDTEMDHILPGYKRLIRNKEAVFDNLEEASISSIEDIYYSLNDLGQLICDDSILAEAYEALLDRSYKKMNGIYYTPKRIAEYMVKKLLHGFDPLLNPFVRILDSTCGSGNFLVYAFDYLLNLYSQKSSLLQERYGDLWDDDRIKKHIIENNLFGADIDDTSVEITIVRLMLKSWGTSLHKANIVVCNSLIKYENLDINIMLKNFWRLDFDYIIANPPYLNMQSSSHELKIYVNNNYHEIFTGENNLYYYFMYRCIEKLKISGKLCLIVPVYFIEAAYGYKIRKFIEENLDIDCLKRIKNTNLFYNASIHCCIMSGTKKSAGLNPYKKISIGQNKKLLLNQNSWIIGEDESFRVIEKLDRFRKLKDYARLCKGMDTGLNKCFLVDKNTIKRFGIEDVLIRDVVRSSDINPYFTRKHRYCILYVTCITDIMKYPNTLRYMRQFKDELQKRYSCQNRNHSWYSISTLRNCTYFESKANRLFSPYRSSKNKFAVDILGSIGLTDTTTIFPHDNIDVYYLAGILNSKLLSFYNMICGKRKGEVYEYFPLPLSQFPVRIAGGYLYENIINDVHNLIMYANLNKNAAKKYRYDIDTAVYEIYGMNSRDIKTVEKYVKDY